MDWNKSNTILIIAFLIVNIFLCAYVYGNDIFVENDKEFELQFKHEVCNILEGKNISIDCDIPDTIENEPFLEVKYKIFYPTEKIVKLYLGDYKGKIDKNIVNYENDNGIFEIVGGKKLKYITKNISKNQIEVNKDVDTIIKEFCKDKNISLGGFKLNNSYLKDDYNCIVYTQEYNGYSLDNSYISFYIKDNVVYQFEQQVIESCSPKATVKIKSAYESLLRLMKFNKVRDCIIKKVEVCYYTDENEDFEDINTINVDLVWKVILNNNNIIYLTGSY